MKNSNEILDTMLGHHALIDLLLTTFKDALAQNLELAERLFDEFRWELDKHIFAEERVVFRFCEPLESEICRIVLGLVKEHDLMIEMLNEVKSNLATKERPDISEFQELLTAHRQVEEKTLYPELDKKLDETQKEMIIARVNEIPIKKEAGAI